MTEAYLDLIKVFNDEDIYIDHNTESFKISINDKEHNVSSRSVKRFINTFLSNNNKDGE